MQLQSICSHWNALPKITANIYWNSPKNTVSWIKSVKCVYLFLLKFHWKKIRSWWHLVPTLQRTKIMPQKYFNVCFYSVRSMHVSLIFFSLTKFETTFVHTRFQSLRCYKNTEIQGLMEMRMDVFFPQWTGLFNLVHNLNMKFKILETFWLPIYTKESIAWYFQMCFFACDAWEYLYTTK